MYSEDHKMAIKQKILFQTQIIKAIRASYKHNIAALIKMINPFIVLTVHYHFVSWHPLFQGDKNLHQSSFNIFKILPLRFILPKYSLLSTSLDSHQMMVHLVCQVITLF